MSHLSNKVVQKRVERISCFALAGLLSNVKQATERPLTSTEKQQLTKTAVDLAIEMSFRLNEAFE